ncbi:hypothetical protein D3C80_1529040 [compost metagenome]
MESQAIRQVYLDNQESVEAVLTHAKKPFPGLCRVKDAELITAIREGFRQLPQPASRHAVAVGS